MRNLESDGADGFKTPNPEKKTKPLWQQIWNPRYGERKPGYSTSAWHRYQIRKVEHG